MEAERFGFPFILIDFHGFPGHGDPRSENLWKRVAGLRLRLLPLEEDGRLQSCRLGG
jgi:hypothetical protein